LRDYPILEEARVNNRLRIERRGSFVKVLFLVLFVFLAVGCEDEHIAKGHEIFSRYCSACHGEKGDGTGYNASNLDPHPRDLTDGDEEYMSKLSNDEIFEVLQLGGYGVDLSGGMPVWGKVFSEQELWSLVAYVRTLHPNEGNEIVFTKPGTEEPVFEKKRVRYPRVKEKKFYDLLEAIAPDEETFQEQVTLGEEIFGEVGCNACHKVDGEGGELGPDLSRAGFMLQTQFIFRWILNPQSFKPKTRMANLDLNEEDAFAIALYVGTLKGPPPGQTETSEEVEADDDGGV